MSRLANLPSSTKIDNVCSSKLGQVRSEGVHVEKHSIEHDLSDIEYLQKWRTEIIHL